MHLPEHAELQHTRIAHISRMIRNQRATFCADFATFDTVFRRTTRVYPYYRGCSGVPENIQVVGKEIGAARQQAPDTDRTPNHHEGNFYGQYSFC